MPRYVKQKDLTFDCITPSSWHRNHLNNDVYSKKKEEAFWKMLDKLKIDISAEKLADIEAIQRNFIKKRLFQFIEASNSHANYKFNYKELNS